MERILLLVEETPGAGHVGDWAVRLCRRLSARLFALSVIPARPLLNARSPVLDAEEKAWRLLYEVEDAAFAENVPASLLLETGDPLQRLGELCRSYKIELIVVSTDSRVPALELIRRTPSPVVFVKPPKED
ncbi:MAG: universal stress protein [candidate division WOR-3 bacterium]